MIVRRRFRFESAHRLPKHPGKCQQLHGHSFVLTVSVERPVDPATGMAVDFGDVKRVVHEAVIDRVDHRYLNEFLEDPTAERIAVWIWNRLVEPLPGLCAIELHETENCSVIYRGE